MSDKRKPGRPALPEGAGKVARVEMRVTPATKAAWQAKADAAGMTLQAWIEKQCNKSKQPPLCHKCHGNGNTHASFCEKRKTPNV